MTATPYDPLLDALADRVADRVRPVLLAVIDERQRYGDRLAFTIGEAAQALALSEAKVREEIASGALAATRFGTAWRVSRAALEQRLLGDVGARPYALPQRGRPRKVAP